MGQLTGQKIKDSYKDLLQIGNSNAGVDGTLRNVEDGEGTSSPLMLSQTQIKSSSNTAVQSGVVSFVHNFVDDLGTGNHYLPWSDEIESSLAGGRYYFAMPYSSILLNRFVIRFRAMNTASTMTLQLGTVDDGQAVTSTNFSVIATASFSQDATDNKSYILNHSAFNVLPEITQTATTGNGKLVAMRLQSDIDPQNASNEIYCSTSWGVTL